MKPIPLNNTPDLSMAEITKKLFNNKFLSDIQFSVGDQIIYAHSLELMKRSRAFEEQLESTWNEKKLIPIDTVQYGSFYQFIRFIYTDECDIDNEIGFELLTLAITFKVTKLENQVINYLLYYGDISLYLKIYEYCIQENYGLILDRATSGIALNFKHILSLRSFETIQPNALESILQLDHIESGVKEIEILNALVRWVKRYCAEHELILSEHKQQFQKYLNLIRFSAMTDQEVSTCVSENSDLFSDRELALFYMQMLPKTTTDTENTSITMGKYKIRKEFRSRLQEIPLNIKPSFSTTFIVSQGLLLTGIRFGANNMNNCEIVISSYMIMDDVDRLYDTDYHDNDISFNIRLQKNGGSCCLSLGESIELEPGAEYRVNVNFTCFNTSDGDAEPSYNILCRSVNQPILVNNDVSRFVRILKSGLNMIEMEFKTL